MNHLEGVRVLDLGSAVAGPFSATLLGDLGAEVLKVEKPKGGDMMRFTDRYVQSESGYYMGVNRGKEGLTIDVREPDGQDLIRRLIADVDILIENFRPHRMAEWGLDYETLKAINPRLIYCSVSAFGDAKGYATQGGNDIVAQAASGLMDLTGEEGGAPAKAGAPVVDVAGALYATIGILAALHRRGATGCGEHLRVSLLEASYGLMPNYILSVLNGTPDFKRQGSAHPQLAPYQTYRTADGSYLVVGVFHKNSWHGFCRAIGKPELVDDPRFVSNWERVKRRAELNAIIEPILLESARADWLERFTREGLLAAPVLSLADSLSQFSGLIDGLVVPAHHSSLGELKMLRSPIRFDGDAPASQRRASPMLGEHTDRRLSALGLDSGEVAELRSRGII
ncbi:MAG: CoA transferase [Sphingomonadales bacterium]|nr:MAG: CoA transferase [Sphingomonadales bacterium]